MNQSSNNTLFAKYMLELPLVIFLLTFLYRITLTQFSTLFNLHLHVSLHVDTFITVLPLKLFHFQTPNPKHVPPILLLTVLHVDVYSTFSQSFFVSQF